MTLDPGVVLNHRYRILSILGQGGMGSVYRAMDLNLSVEVALKENLYLTEEYTRQFKREAAILATLRHPNLPKVTDHFEIPSQGQYLVMEFITGEDLRDRMDREGELDEAEVIHIGASICDALSYLHSRTPPVLHRDIKPGNIRITDEGHILLVDFGLAKLQLGTQETTNGARAMTPGYSPPEQYGSSRTDARSDIYALGATLFAALGNMAPEDSLSRLTDFTELSDLRSLNPKVTKKMVAVVEKALELRAEDRYQSADAMKLALLSVLGEKPVSRPITITPPPGAAEYKIRQNPQPIQPTSNSRRKKSSGRETRNLAFVAFIATLVILGVISATIFVLAQSGLLRQSTQTAIALLPERSLTVAIEKPTNLPPTQKAVENTSVPAPADIPIPLPTVPYSAAVEPTMNDLQVTENTTVATIGGPSISGEIAFATMRDGFPQIWLMNTDGSNQRQLTNLKEGACQPDWSPNGKQVVFISPCQNRDSQYKKGNMFIINRDGTNLTILDAGVGGNYDPNWSPDGTKIAFTKVVSSFTQIYQMDLVSGTVSALVDSELSTSQPVWSPDGTKIAYIQSKYDAEHIWIFELGTNNNWQLTKTKNQDDSQPAWSSDGKTIFFTHSSIADYNPSLAGINVDRNGSSLEYPIPLANHPVPLPAGDADLSHDGQWMVFEGWPDGKNHDIYLMNITGEVVTRLTEASKIDFQAVWNPVSIP